MNNYIQSTINITQNKAFYFYHFFKKVWKVSAMVLRIYVNLKILRFTGYIYKQEFWIFDGCIGVKPMPVPKHHYWCMPMIWMPNLLVFIPIIHGGILNVAQFFAVVHHERQHILPITRLKVTRNKNYTIFLIVINFYLMRHNLFWARDPVEKIQMKVL